jgi:hypothetical protein
MINSSRSAVRNLIRRILLASSPYGSRNLGALVRISVNQPQENRHGDDSQVEGKTPVLEIAEVLLDPLWNGGVATAESTDLCQPSDAELHIMSGHLTGNFLAEFLGKECKFWTRSDNTPIALEYIKKLRKLRQIHSAAQGESKRHRPGEML